MRLVRPIERLANEDPDRARLILVVREVIARRERGEVVSDAEVLAAHPDLLPQLVDELALVRDIDRAFARARHGGPVEGRLDIMTVEELEQPIDLDADSAPEDSGAFGAPLKWDAGGRFLAEGTSRRGAVPTAPGYLVLEEINRGGQAVVYRAVQESTGRKVAVKVLPGGALAGSRRRARLDREARILAAVEHPNVVSIVDRGLTTDGSHFIAVDFVAGDDLDEYLKRELGRSVSWRDVVQMFVKLARVVHEVHQLGVVHRDLKPSNVRVDRRGEPHVLDFGLARWDEEENVLGEARCLSVTGQVVGSLAWMAPEQLDGRNAIDARTDVYSLALMLHYAFADALPYGVFGPLHEVTQRIAKSPPEMLSRCYRARRLGVPEALAPVLLKALSKRPDDRYATASALADDLVAVLADRHPVAQRPAAKRRVGFAAFAISATVLTGLLAVGDVVARRPRGFEPPYTVFQLPTYTNSVGMKFVRISPGEFLMGSPPIEPDRENNETWHAVRLTRRFYLGVTEVTDGQYAAVMGPGGPTTTQDPNLPARGVTRLDAIEFCRRLSQREGRTYRLPTEAEWEYACRAGSSGKFAGTGKPEEMGWYDQTSGGHVHPVGLKTPNVWGLYDMLGNVREWCADGYLAVLPDRQAIDPLIEGDHGTAVLRGGGYDDPVSSCRTPARLGTFPDRSSDDTGFRVALEPESQPK